MTLYCAFHGFLFVVRPMFAWVFAICARLAIYSLSRNFSDVGNNFDGMTLDATSGVTINAKNNGYIGDIQLMAVSLVTIPIWLSGFRLISLVPLGAFVLARAGTGGRGTFIAVIL